MRNAMQALIHAKINCILLICGPRCLVCAVPVTSCTAKPAAFSAVRCSSVDQSSAKVVRRRLGLQDSDTQQAERLPVCSHCLTATPSPRAFSAGVVKSTRPLCPPFLFPPCPQRIQLVDYRYCVVSRAGVQCEGTSGRRRVTVSACEWALGNQGLWQLCAGL